MPKRRLYVAVVGAGACDARTEGIAEQVGRQLAKAGAVLVCGGLGGVMQAACRGARSERGTTIGVLPTDDRESANPHVEVAIATGLGEFRNALIVRTSDAVIAIGGEFGTLSEIALALKMGKPVVGINTWELVKDGKTSGAIVRAGSAEDAVRTAIRLGFSNG